MGRSQLQGTPWHYEYAKGKDINNSKNCAFNTGERCACKISPNHNGVCVGKSNCDEFERSSFQKTTKNKSINKSIKNNIKSKSQNRSSQSQQQPKINTVQLGDKVVVKSMFIKENVIFRITDKKNPFYLKKLNSTVSIKGRQYRIIEIIKP